MFLTWSLIHLSILSLDFTESSHIKKIQMDWEANKLPSSSPVPLPDSPKQQGRGPAAGDEVGGLWVQSSKSPESSLFPPPDPPKQQGRGPAAGGEVGGKWVQSTQTPESPTDPPTDSGGKRDQSSKHPFSYTDVRERQTEEEREQMSVSIIIGHLNKLCVQKPGGSFVLPKISESDFCILCNRGCIYLGPSCKGPPTSS